MMRQILFLGLLTFSIGISSSGECLAKACITGDNVSLRTGPDRSSEKIGSVALNQIVEIQSRSTNTELIDGTTHYWFFIKTKKDQTGWVYGKYVGKFHEYKWVSFSGADKPMKRDMEHPNEPEGVSYNLVKNGEYVPYSLSYPSIWEARDGQFYDFHGDKVIDAILVLIPVKEDEKYIPSEEYSERVLSEEESTVNNKRCIKRVIELVCEGCEPEWSCRCYRYDYLLIGKQHSLNILFYIFSDDRDKDREKVFDKVVDTVEFE